MLSNSTFSDIIRHTPLVSIDFVIENDANEILLGLRTNPPAQNFWFVPGGRIYKNETMEKAKLRIFKTELGQEFAPGSDMLLGLYDHIYEENTFESEGFGTHYVVLAHRLRLSDLSISTDDQHEAFQWWNPEDALADPQVHDLTKAYLNALK